MRKQLSQDESSSSVGTLARGLDILELFGGDSPELTQKEISERLDLPVPTVHRLAKVLVERGWLARDPASRRLRLGLGATRLMSGLPLPNVAREHLRGLADRTGETANLATLDDGEVLYLMSETGSHLLTLRSHAGLRLPVHCTALGKALLAQLPDEEARRAAGAGPYRAFTDRTITGWDELGAGLKRVRRDGVAHSRDEFEVGLRSVAVPLGLAGPDGPVATGPDGPLAINVSLPTSRAGRDAVAEITRELRATAEAIRGAAA